MSGQEAILTVILYGCNERRVEHESRVELELRPRLPADIANDVDKKTAWLRNLLMGAGGIVKDMKHSHDWRCEFCAKPARQTIVSMASWTHLSPPRMTAYIHCMCDVSSGRCMDEFEAMDREMARLGGTPFHPQPRTPKVPGVRFPLLGACAGCERDATAGPGAGQKGTLMRCGACKLTRYCSKECQKEDWRRHKTACKCVMSIKWVLDPE